MKNKVILLLFLFAFRFTRGGGQTIHINYNNGEKLYKIRTK